MVLRNVFDGDTSYAYYSKASWPMNTPQTTACCDHCNSYLLSNPPIKSCSNPHCPCHSKTITHTEDWRQKIRDDYKNILSPNQIETTIDYWEAFISALLLKQRKETIADEIKGMRALVRLLNDMYGRGGCGAIYDTINDYIDRHEKENLATLESFN